MGWVKELLWISVLATWFCHRWKENWSCEEPGIAGST